MKLQKISIIIRRTHMYLGLFLSPWLLVYVISTIGINHRDFILQFYEERFSPFDVVQEEKYEKVLSDTEEPRDIAVQILKDLNLEGAHNVRGGRNGNPLIITRNDPLVLTRVTYDPTQQLIEVAKQRFRTQSFVDRLHFRLGYRHNYLPDDIWGLLVDINIIAMMFWCLSGLWLWWELKSTRKWGLISTVSGVIVFALFLMFL